MLQILALVAPLFGLILLGYISGRVSHIPVEGLAWLSFFIVYIALPALLFNLVSQTSISQFANPAYLIRTTLVTFAIFAICFSIAKLARRASTEAATIQGFAGAYGNIGYMGPPLAIAAFGPEAGVPVALIFCLDNSMHFILAPSLMAVGNSGQQSVFNTISGIIRNIFTHPFILATMAGIAAAAMQYKPDGVIESLLNTLSAAAAPCALFAMGVTAALRPLKRVPAELSYLLPIKLIVHPLLMYLVLFKLPGIEPVWLHSAVLLAALPTAANVFVIAQQYNVWEERASSAVVLSTLISSVTVTLYLYLARSGTI